VAEIRAEGDIGFPRLSDVSPVPDRYRRGGATGPLSVLVYIRGGAGRAGRVQKAERRWWSLGDGVHCAALGTVRYSVTGGGRILRSRPQGALAAAVPTG